MNSYIRIFLGIILVMHQHSTLPNHLWGLTSDIDSKVDILLVNDATSCGIIEVSGPGAITITSAGHYCLKSNTSGITISASNVVLDLSGNTVGSSGILLTGDATSVVRNIIIQNGFIVGSGSIGNGISVVNTTNGFVNIQLSNLSISNFSNGIRATCSLLTASKIILMACTIGMNITSCNVTSIRDSRVHSCTTGIEISSGRNINLKHCIATLNTNGYVITGPVQSISLINCIAQNNSLVGFQTGSSAIAGSCQNGMVVQNCLSVGNATGFQDSTSSSGARQYFSNIASASTSSSYAGAGITNFNIGGAGPVAPSALVNEYQNITIINPVGC